MYLLDTRTLALEFFHSHRDVPYAILSHRWREGEVLFQDLEEADGTSRLAAANSSSAVNSISDAAEASSSSVGNDPGNQVKKEQRQPPSKATRKKGFVKLHRFCTIALQEGYEYAWCDACCIDKRSSAELGEAINSMFSWYRDAGICIAFLDDVADVALLSNDELPEADPEEEGAKRAKESEFGKSVWWTRGWTLQELLAPRSLTFYSRDWKALGSASDLSHSIAAITGIHHEMLCEKRAGASDGAPARARAARLSDFTIAQRMSWAAHRKTTRGEDMAYSLLGICEVNMPLLYGEGSERAFARLQREIVAQSSDQSILLHASPTVLATCPADFRDSRNIRPAYTPLIGQPYNLTNRGLSIELLMFPWTLDTYFALLDCSDGSNESAPTFWGHVGIFLEYRIMPTYGLGVNDSGGGGGGGSAKAAPSAFRVRVAGKAWMASDRQNTHNLPSLQSRILIFDSRASSFGDDGIPRSISNPKRYGFRLEHFRGRNDWAERSGKLLAVTWDDSQCGEWPVSSTASSSSSSSSSSSTPITPSRFLNIPTGTYVTAGIVHWTGTDDTGHPYSVPIRLGFTPHFQPVLEFGFARRDPAALLARKNQVLSDTSWLSPNASKSHPHALRFQGPDRVSAVSELRKWGLFGDVAVYMRKEVHEGAECWTVDVDWQSGGGRGLLPVRDVPVPARIVCDGCGKWVGAGGGQSYFHCRDCEDYDLCSTCIVAASSVHDEAHEFDAMGPRVGKAWEGAWDT